MLQLKDIRANFCQIWVKNSKKQIIFKNFTLDNQSLNHKIDDNIISFLTKMLLKELFIWAFWGQDMGPGWIKNGQLFSYQPPYYQKQNFKLYDPFLWMGFNCLKARATSRRQFIFTIKFPEISGTSFIDLRRMNAWVDLGATSNPVFPKNKVLNRHSPVMH